MSMQALMMGIMAAGTGVGGTPPVVEAPAVADFSEYFNSGIATHNLAMPAGVAEGDLLAMFLGWSDSRNLNTDLVAAGWVEVLGQTQHTTDQNPRGAVYTKTAVAAEPSRSVGFSGVCHLAAGIVRLTGWGVVEPIGLNNSSANQTPVCPSLTTGGVKRRILRVHLSQSGQLADVDANYPAGTTGLFSKSTVEGSSSGSVVSMGIAHHILEEQGPTGTASWTKSGGFLTATRRWFGMTLAIGHVT